MGFEQDNAAMLTKMDDLLGGIAQYYADAGNTKRTFYVDQAGGNDGNAGKLATPLASSDEAMRRGVPGGVTTIWLMSDYVVSTSVITTPGAVSILSHGSRRTLSFADNVIGEVVTGVTYAPRVVVYFGGGSLWLEGVEVRLGTYAGVPDYRHAIHSGPLSRTFMRDVNLVVPPGSDQVLFAPGVGLNFTYSSGIVDAAMPGRWVQGIAAGTDPWTVRNILYTNLGAL